MQTYKRMVALAGVMLAFAASSPSFASNDEALKKSQTLYNNRKYEDAIATLNKAIEADSKDERSFFLRAQSKEMLSKYDQAIDDYTQCVQMQPRDLASYMHMSACWSKLGKNNVAISCLSKALLLDAKNPSLYKARADLYEKVGQKAQAKNDRDVAGVLAGAGK
ncbi:MAG TPA: CDC27 family protein [Planktothrix sp.]|jgi:tetratricopeptide (TPR) repeat protein